MSARAQKIRVLLVEDAVDDALLVRSYFGDLPDFTVTHTQDGDRALALLREGGWDLVVADLNVPGADGYEVIRAARAEAGPPPILAITAYTQERYWDRAFEAGADQVLVKPLDKEAFLTRVRSMIRGGTPEHPPDQETIVVVEGLLGDAVMGCGGTARIAVRNGARVLLAPLLDPEALDARELEAVRAAADTLGIGFRLTEAVAAAPGRAHDLVARVLEELRPSAVYVPARGDGVAARARASRAVRSLTRPETRILGYQTATTPAGFAPDRFVDIRAQMACKVEALAPFTRLDEPRRDLDSALARAYARYWGRFRGFSEVEPFETIHESRMP